MNELRENIETAFQLAIVDDAQNFEALETSLIKLNQELVASLKRGRSDNGGRSYAELHKSILEALRLNEQLSKAVDVMDMPLDHYDHLQATVTTQAQGIVTYLQQGD